MNYGTSFVHSTVQVFFLVKNYGSQNLTIEMV
jgi:hypothetical protein